MKKAFSQLSIDSIEIMCLLVTGILIVEMMLLILLICTNLQDHKLHLTVSMRGININSSLIMDRPTSHLITPKLEHILVYLIRHGKKKEKVKIDVSLKRAGLAHNQSC